MLKERYLNTEDIKLVYSEKRLIEDSLQRFDSGSEQSYQIKYIEKLIEDGELTLEEGIMALRYTNKDEQVENTLNTMGFIVRKEQLA